MAFMTGNDALRQAGSPKRAAELSQKHAQLGLDALIRQDFSAASVELQKASAFAGALACIVGMYNGGAKLLGKPIHVPKVGAPVNEYGSELEVARERDRYKAALEAIRSGSHKGEIRWILADNALNPKAEKPA